MAEMKVLAPGLALSDTTQAGKLRAYYSLISEGLGSSIALHWTGQMWDHTLSVMFGWSMEIAL